MADASGAGSEHTITALLAARGLRDFGEGLVAVILPAHLLALGFSACQVGVLSSAALLGLALLTLGVGIAGARHVRRGQLLAAAGLPVSVSRASDLLRSSQQPTHPQTTAACAPGPTR